MRFRNQTDRNRLDADFAANAIRIGYVISRRAWNERGVDGSGNPARRTGDHIDATRHQFARQDDRILDGPFKARPIRRRASEKYRPILRPYRPHGFRDFERETHAALQISAISIVAPVRQRTEKLMNQVAMRAVNFADIESGIDATDCRITPGFDHLANVRH